MDLSSVQSVYQNEGPFATIYLEGRGPTEDAAHQLRLRWDGLRARLTQEGAEKKALDAVEQHLFEAPAGEVQADGRVLVASIAGVHLDQAWDAALGAGDVAHWAEVPELGAFVRERARSVRMLVVLASQEGAAVRQEIAAEGHDLSDLQNGSVEGSSTEGVHKPRGGALSHHQIQRRAEEAIQQNARDVVEYLTTTAKTFQPHVLVLAGEEQGRKAINRELPKDLSEICVQADRGGSDDDAAEAALAEQLRQIARSETDRRMAERTEELAQAMAYSKAVTGAENVAHAAQMSAVDTLLLQYRTPARDEGTLLSSCALGGANADLVDTEIQDGVAALLRFPLPSQPKDGENT